MSADRVPTCVWRATPELIVVLDDKFGEPIDSYVNGSQVWMREDGPDEIVLQWRLHPVAGYKRPAGVETDAVFGQAALALATGESPPAPLIELWDGLECFAAYGDDVEPAILANAAAAALGLTPDASGLVDHEAIADAWENSRGATSITAALFGQLNT
ncbi:MAG: hypothetical protein H0U92_15000 [Actinobacteria bacterium]|nr:hypothetical protein [Actinomycetota bacterium]